MCEHSYLLDTDIHKKFQLPLLMYRQKKSLSTPNPMPDAETISTDEALAHLSALPRGASALLLGATDTGKTSFALAATLTLARAGRNVAVVDCDLGQSEIGPPGTVGVGLAEPATADALRSLRSLAPVASYFVGATSPIHHALDVCVGACQMARVAKKRHPDLILIDTCGWTQGPAACRFKRRLAELLVPQTVLAFARGHELDPLLAPFGRLQRPDVCRVAPSAEAGRKTSAARATRRAARFLAALDGARDIPLVWDDVALVGTALGQGSALPHHVLQFLCQSLRLPVLHAEQGPDGALYAVVNGERWDAAGLSAIQTYLHSPSVTIVPAQKFAGLLVGLISAQGALLDVGLIARIDFAARTLTVHTPCRRPAAVAQVWLGVQRLRPDGRERGENRPGEI